MYCDAEASHFLSAKDRNRRTTASVFDYYKCMNCGLIFMSSPPRDMAPFYAGGYDPIPSSSAELQGIAAREKYRTAPVLARKPKGRCLEIGPWRGVICSNMKDAGFEVTAIEMDANCVEFLRNKLGVDATQSCDPAAVMENLDPGFDVIISCHSLEHIPNAWRVIEEAGRLLSRDGILLLAMPNPDSFEFSVLKSAWYHLDAPRHLCLFPIPTLVEICRKNNLEPLEITSNDRFSRIQSAQGWRSFVRSILPVRYVRAGMEWTLGTLLYGLTYLPQMRHGRGSAYTAIFRKTDEPKRLIEPEVEVSGAA